MIIDCSTEITVLVKESNQVIEKYRTTGNDYSSVMSVWNNFLEVLVTIFGSPMMRSFRTEDPKGYLDLQREFESIRKSFKRGKSRKITLKVPKDSLDCFCQKHLDNNIKDVILTSEYGDDISLNAARLRINSDLFHNLFKKTIGTITNLIANVFAEYKDAYRLTDIIIVGDFSECIVIQDAVKQTFSDKNIIVLEEGVGAVMKGAVLYGYQPCQYIQKLSSEVRQCRLCGCVTAYMCYKGLNALCLLNI